MGYVIRIEVDINASKEAVWDVLVERLPVLHLLEDRLAPGALVIADDTTFASMSGYPDYVRTPAHGYASVAFPVDDGMEISCRTGATAHA